MNARTVTALEVLENTPWFTHLGVKDATTALVLSSWKESLEHCSEVDWENLCLTALNQYGVHVRAKAEDRFNKWNDVSRDVKPRIGLVIKAKTDELVIKHQLPKVFVDSVHWDILGACMELEYADVHPPGFFANQLYWYLRGHFPCGAQAVRVKGRYPEMYPPGFYDRIANWYKNGDFGDWQGQIPKGKLIVY